MLSVGQGPNTWAVPLPPKWFTTKLLTQKYSISSCSGVGGSKREEWSDFRATSDHLARRVSSSTIDCLRNCSPPCFFHQRFVNWPGCGKGKEEPFRLVETRKKRDQSGSSSELVVQLTIARAWPLRTVGEPAQNSGCPAVPPCCHREYDCQT